MSKVDWSKAPDGAEFYADGSFKKPKYKSGNSEIMSYSADGYWFESMLSKHNCELLADYEPCPHDWPDESRIDTIGTNGNDGRHYMKVCPLNEGSMHYDEFRAPTITISGPITGSAGGSGSNFAHDNKIATNKYQRDIVGLDGTKTTVDVYRVLDAFKTESAAIDHAVKKLLAPGLRHSKNRKQDLQEAIDSIAAELLLMEQK